MSAAPDLSLDILTPLVGGPTNRTKKWGETARTPAEFREFMDSGRRLDILRQTDLSLACVRAGLKCWALLYDLNTIAHFPPSELAVRGRSSFFAAWRTFRMSLAHSAKGCQPNDCDATSWFTKNAKEAAKSLFKPKGSSSATRPAIAEDQICQLVTFFFLRDWFFSSRHYYPGLPPFFELGGDSDEEEASD